MWWFILHRSLLVLLHFILLTKGDNDSLSAGLHVYRDAKRENIVYMICYAFGYPPPNTTIMVKHCPDDNFFDESYEELPLEFNTYIQLNQSLEYPAPNGNLYLNTAGIDHFEDREFKVECNATNSSGNKSMTKESTMTFPKETYYPEDNVTLVCFIPVILFNDTVQWSFTSQRNIRKKLTNSTVKNAKNWVRESKYQNIADTYWINYTLTIQNVTNKDAGVYNCTMNMKAGVEVYEEHIVLVSDSKQPATITYSNFNNDTISTNLGQHTVSLTCDYEGSPFPSITWLKDDKVISNHNLDKEPRARVYDKDYKFDGVMNNLRIFNIKETNLGLFKCVVENRFGKEERFVNLILLDEKSRSIQVGIITGLICFIVIVGLSIYFYGKVREEKRKRNEQRMKDILAFIEGDPVALKPDVPLSNQSILLPYDKKWEINSERLTLDKVLGSGEFGIVIKAAVKDLIPGEESTTVAVKMVKYSKLTDLSSIKALISELKIMSHLGRHLNIVNLLGACTTNIMQKEILVIVEYCSYGCLKQFLSKRRNTFIDQRNVNEDNFNFNIGLEKIHELNRSDLSTYREIRNLAPITSHDLLCWAFQVASGMNYLGSRNVLHGDLALRNILLTDNDVVKIADFGLSRNIDASGCYTKKGNGLLPVKWLAVESLREGIFSVQSDVWSYGIVLWELFSLSCTPYVELAMDSSFIQMILDGYRLQKPEYATGLIYEMMEDCWKCDPLQRPSFRELAERIGGLLIDRVRNVYVSMNESLRGMHRADDEDPTYDYLNMMTLPDYRMYENM